MKTKILDKINEFELIVQTNDTQDLKSLSIPMQDIIWDISTSEVLPKKVQKNYIISTANNSLEGFASIMRKPGILNGCEFLSVHSIAEPGDLSYKNELVLNKLLKTLVNLNLPLELRRIRSDSLTVPAFDKAFSKKGIVIHKDQPDYPYILLKSNNDDAMSLLSTRLKSDLRRAQRKADSLGVISYEIHSPKTEREFLSLYDMAMNAEAAGWKGRIGTALAYNSILNDFFQRYGIRAAKKGILRLAFMKIDSEVVAMQFAVEYGNRFWLLKIGYNEDYKICSPGNLLMLKTFCYAFNNKLDSYEFLGTSETWTNRWTKLSRPTVRLLYFPYNFIGILALSKFTIKRIKNKLIHIFGLLK